MFEKKCLKISQGNLNNIAFLLHILQLPVANIQFEGIDFSYDEDFQTMKTITDACKCYVKSIKFKDLCIYNLEEFQKLLKDLSYLEYIEFNKVSMCSSSSQVFPSLPKLTTLKFINVNSNIFTILANQQTVVKVFVHSDSKSAHLAQYINELLPTLPNFDHLVLTGGGTAGYFDNSDFQYRISKLEIEALRFERNDQITRTRFFQQSRNSLRELKIHKILLNYDGGRILKYIMENMSLDIFYLGEIPLILGGIQQNVKKITATELDICCCIEMLQQFDLRELTMHF